MPARDEAMTADEYRAILAKLDYTPNGAGPLIGVTRRQSLRYAAGESPVTITVARLLRMYARHGVPKGWGHVGDTTSRARRPRSAKASLD